MSLKAIVKGGLTNGIAVGLAIHWLGVALLYERIYEFEFPSAIRVPLSVVAIVALVVGLLGIGPYVIILAKDGGRTKKEGLLLGAGSGIVVGLMVYLLVGALASTLVLGTVPLIVHLAETSQLDEAGLETVLTPVVKNAISGTYLVILAHLFAGAIMGGLEGLVFVILRDWKRNKSANLAEEEVVSDK
jgi:hypothetical protein